MYTVITNADWLAKNKRFQDAYAPTDPTEVINVVAHANAWSIT